MTQPNIATKSRFATSKIIVGLVSLRGVGVALQFLVSLLVARLTGTAGAGAYALHLSWQRVLGNVVAAGAPPWALREIALAYTSGERDRAIDVSRAARQRIWPFAMTSLACFGVALIVSIVQRPNDLALWALTTALATVVPFAALRLVTSESKGLDRPGRALSAEFVAVPTGLLFALAGSVVFDGDARIIAFLSVSGLSFVASAAGLAVANRRALSGRGRPSKAARNPMPPGVARVFLASTVVNVSLWTVPLIVAGFILSPDDLGPVGVAQRLVALPTYVLISAASWYNPRFARAARTSRVELKRIHRSSQVLGVVTYAPFLFIVATFGTTTMSMFGADFRDDASVLVVLALGQAVNAATGLAGEALQMASQERVDLTASLSGLVLGVIGAVAGSLLYGAEGLAAALALSLATRHLLALWLLRHRTASVHT